MKKRIFLFLALTAALLLIAGMFTALATEGECQHQWKYGFDENYHWYVCEICGERYGRMGHMAYCDAPNVCRYCGMQGDNMTAEHERNWEWHYNETEHWLVCPRCQTEFDHWSHRSWCNESVCSSCGASLSSITAEVDHEINETWYSDEIHHWRKCSRCAEIMDYDEHVEDFLNPGVCKVCGYGQQKAEPTETPVPPTEEPAKPTETPVPPTEEPVGPTETPVQPTEEPAHAHVWVVVEEISATCTEKGYVTSVCDCGETKTEEIPALGHVYKVYVSDGAGRHSASCARCGNTIDGVCTLTETTVNGLKAQVCNRCGYTVSAVAQIVPAPETVIPEAQIEVLEGAALPETAVFTVYDATAALPEGSGAVYAFLMTLTDDGAEITLSGKVRVTLPWAQDVTGMKLLLVRPNGETVEIEYTLVDGVLTFETEELGVFAFVPAQA